MARDPRDIVDIAGLATPQGQSGAAAGRAGAHARPFIAIHFRCCNQYSRVYRNRSGTAYEGACPRCAAPVRASIGPGGTSRRFFEAS